MEVGCYHVAEAVMAVLDMQSSVLQANSAQSWCPLTCWPGLCCKEKQACSVFLQHAVASSKIRLLCKVI